VIHTPAEERIRRALPAAARLAGITADARQLGILARAAAKAVSKPTPPRKPVPRVVLSRDEMALLRLLAKGLRRDALGAALGLSPSAAEKRAQRLRIRLGAGTRIELVARGYELGLLGGER
jgi:DNA-binding NarL/FixJ family response regulator